MNITDTEELVDKFYRIAGEEWDHFSTSVNNFVDAVDWKEPFIVGLMIFHAVVFLIAVITRKKSTFQAILFLFLLKPLMQFLVGLVFCAQYINDYCIKNWKLFATQKYFEESGFFISIMMSAPALLMSFFILINFLIESMKVLIDLKSKELKQKMRQERLAKEKEAKKQK